MMVNTMGFQKTEKHDHVPKIPENKQDMLVYESVSPKYHDIYWGLYSIVMIVKKDDK